MKWAVWAALALAACSDERAWPEAHLRAVSPDHIDSFAAEPLEISGVHLYADVATGVVRDPVRTDFGFRGWVGGKPLVDVTWVSNELLRATSAPLAAGVYGLEVETPTGDRIGLERAITVRDGGGTQSAHGEVEDVRNSTRTFATTDIVADEPLVPAVEPDRSVLLFNLRHDSVTPHDGQVCGQIVDGGQTVRLRRYGTGVGVETAWTVLQHSDLRVQRGSTPLPDSPTTAQLDSPVDLARSFVIATLCISGGSYNWNDWVRAELTDPSTLVLSSGIDEQNPNAVVEWQVVSFVPEANATVTKTNVTLGVGDVSAVVFAGGVSEERSFVSFTQHSIQSSNVAAHNQVRGRLEGGELRFDRVGAAIDIEVTAYLVTWPALTVEHGSLNFPTAELNRRAALSQCPVASSAAVSFLPSGMRQGSSALDWDDGVGGGWFTSQIDDCEIVVERAVADAEADADWTVFWIQ